MARLLFRVVWRAIEEPMCRGAGRFGGVCERLNRVVAAIWQLFGYRGSGFN